MMTAELSAIADQIAKGVDPKRCTYATDRGYFRFFYITSISTEAISVSASIGSISAEWLEHVDAQKPREKRRLIRSIIRGLRDAVRDMEVGDE
jgi:hypothetical protein